MLDRFLPSKIQKRLSSYTQFDTEKETGGLRKAASKEPKEKKMPSWEQASDGYPCYSPYYAHSASKSTLNVSTTPVSRSQVNISSTQSRRKSAMVSASYLPLPYVKPRSMSPSTTRKPMPRMDSGISLPSPTESSTQQPEGRRLKPFPLSLLPSLPQAIRAHPRNELQRRNSPTSSGGFESFSPRSPCFSPLSPQSPANAAPAVQRVPTWPVETKVDGPVILIQEKQEKKMEEEEREKEKETESEEIYTLTLLTTPSLTDNAAKLRLHLTTTSSPLPPSNITLFPALPAKQLGQIKGHLFLLADKIKAFEVSTGAPTKRHDGQIMLSVAQGEREIRRLFVSLRTNWWTLLSDADRAYQGVGWPLFNDSDNIDIGTVDETSRAINEMGVVRGWATGVCLWKMREGTWVVEKEYTFTRDDRMVDKSIRVRVRSLMSPSQEVLALRWESSIGRPQSV